jgi:hypothetical protein
MATMLVIHVRQRMARFDHAAQRDAQLDRTPKNFSTPCPLTVVLFPQASSLEFR